MRTTYVPLPEAGFYFDGQRPSSLEVTEVPPAVSDEDLAAFVGRLCATPQGMHLGSGAGFRNSLYSLNFRILLRRAKERGVEPAGVPELPRSRIPAGLHVVDGVECNENGQPLRPQPTAPVRARKALLRGGFVEI